MLPNMKTSLMKGTLVPRTNLCQVNCLKPRYSNEDWNTNNEIKFRISCDQERLAERIVEESRRVIDDVNDTTKNWQREVEYHLRERANEIRFLCDELKKQKKTAMLEDEALNTYRDRVLNAINFLKQKSLAICERCLILREGRLSVDLCADNVDNNIRRELNTIKGCQSLMNKTLNETIEQLRKLRSTVYYLDKDLSQKDISLIIDEKNLRLRETKDLFNANQLYNKQCLYSLNEWQQQTYLNLESNGKELNSASQLRGYIDLLLKQVCEDMQNQTERTNEAFESRINELKYIKKCLENKHNDTLNHISEVKCQIDILEQDMTDKNRALQLCLTRLSNRATRPGLEMTCDDVQDALYNEHDALKTSMCKLQQKIIEIKASLRYLLHVQVMQEEEINIKANSIKIDEVDCMPIRQVLKYQSF